MSPIVLFKTGFRKVYIDVQIDHVCKRVALTTSLAHDLLTIAAKLVQLIFDTLLVFLIKCQGQFD